jgi:hypothetical protein
MRHARNMPGNNEQVVNANPAAPAAISPDHWVPLVTADQRCADPVSAQAEIV